jgi:hypothetical protein
MSSSAEGSVKRGLELLQTLDALLAESAADEPRDSPQRRLQQQHQLESEEDCVANSTGEGGDSLRLRSDLAEYLTRTLQGLDLLAAGAQPNAKAQHTAENLRHRLQRVHRLHVYSPPSSRSLHYFQLRPFRGLRELVLEDTPPSLAVDLFSAPLRKCLRRLSMTRCGITGLAEVLAPVSASLRQSLAPMVLADSALLSLPPPRVVWRHVTALSLCNCGLSRIDEALHFFPQLRVLDLSHNRIEHVAHLQDCIALRELDLSHNRVRVLSNLDRVLGKLRHLRLAHNAVQSLDGVDRIYSLESLDLAHNLVDDVAEVGHVCRLPCLEALVLAHNPLADRQKQSHYRLRVFTEFLKVGSVMSGNRAFPSLDGREIRRKELQKLRRLLFRAPSDAMVESSYGSHAMDDWDLDLDQLLNDLDHEDHDDGDNDNDEDVDALSVSRLSLASPLAADAFRRLSTSRLSQTAGGSPSPLRRRNSLERGGGGQRDRFRSSEYQSQASHSPQPQSTRESLYSVRDSSALNPALRMSLALKRFHNRRLSASTASPSSSSSSSAVTAVARRQAEISDGQTIVAAVDLQAIAADIAAHPERWKLQALSPCPPSLPSCSAAATAADPLPAQSCAVGSERDATRSNSDAESVKAVPADGTPVRASRMDDFIGRIHDKTEFRSFNAAAAAAAAAENQNSDDEDKDVEVEVDDEDDHQPGSGGPAMTTAAVATTRESLVSRLSDLPFDSAGVNPHRQVSQDSVMLEVDPYVGDAQYRSLSVLDNLELYFREQVFPSNRPSFPNLYLRTKPTSARDHSLNLVTPFAPEERFITLFFEKVIDLKDPSISIKSSYNIADPAASSATAATGRGVEEFIPQETYVALVLTDMGFYVVDVSEINSKISFADSPLLVVVKFHPLYKLGYVFCCGGCWVVAPLTICLTLSLSR